MIHKIKIDHFSSFSRIFNFWTKYGHLKHCVMVFYGPLVSYRLALRFCAFMSSWHCHCCSSAEQHVFHKVQAAQVVTMTAVTISWKQHSRLSLRNAVQVFYPMRDTRRRTFCSSAKCLKSIKTSQTSGNFLLFETYYDK